MNDNKKINTIIVLLVMIILLLVVQNYNYKNRYESLQSSITAFQSNIDNTANELNSNITSYIDFALNQSLSSIDSYTISYDGIDVNNKTVNVHLNFRLKETASNTEIQVHAIPIEETAPEKNSFHSVTSNGIDYTSDFTLSYLANYNFDIYETDGQGYQKKLNSEIIEKHIISDFDNRTRSLSSGTSVSNEGIQVDFELVNQTFGEEGFKIKTIELILLMDSEEMYRDDITDRNIVNSAELQQYNLSVASGDIQGIEAATYDAEFGEIQIDEEGVEYGNYVTYITHEAILGKIIKDNSLPQYEIRVEVTYVNGEIMRIM